MCAVEDFSREGTGVGNVARNLLILSLGVGGAGTFPVIHGR